MMYNYCVALFGYSFPRIFLISPWCRLRSSFLGRSLLQRAFDLIGFDGIVPPIPSVYNSADCWTMPRLCHAKHPHIFRSVRGARKAALVNNGVGEGRFTMSPVNYIAILVRLFLVDEAIIHCATWPIERVYIRKAADKAWV